MSIEKESNEKGVEGMGENRENRETKESTKMVTGSKEYDDIIDDLTDTDVLDDIDDDTVNDTGNGDDNKSSKKNGGTIILVGIIIVIIFSLVAFVLKSQVQPSDEQPIESVENNDESLVENENTDDKDAEEVDEKDIKEIVDSVVGKSGCTTTDRDELWKLYLLDSQMKDYAVYIDIKDTELNAVMIIEPMPDCESELNESISLVRSGFIGGMGDDNRIVVSDSYVSKVGKYTVLVLGKDAKSKGEQIENILQG